MRDYPYYHDNLRERLRDHFRKASNRDLLEEVLEDCGGDLLGERDVRIRAQEIRKEIMRRLKDWIDQEPEMP